MSHLVETMFSVRQVPWHKLGKVLNNPPTSKEAIIQAGLDWEVIMRDVYFKNDNTGDFYKVSNRCALVRTSDNTPLSIVSNTYKILQNKEAFDWFDTFIQSGQATYETAGSLQSGKKIWILAKLSGSFDVVKGDEIRKYVLLCNGHDGITSIMIQPTPIRVVCNNTLMASLGTGMINSIWHHGNIKDKMEKVKSIMGLAEQDFLNKQEIYNQMKSFSINDLIIGHYINKLIPDVNENASEKVKDTNLAQRERIWELHENGFGSNIPGVRGSMWGLYNSAIEFAEYDLPKKVRDLGNYQIFGVGAQFKQRAFDIALNIMQEFKK